jgi:hypothetical protein
VSVGVAILVRLGWLVASYPRAWWPFILGPSSVVSATVLETPEPGPAETDRWVVVVRLDRGRATDAETSKAWDTASALEQFDIGIEASGTLIRDGRHPPEDPPQEDPSYTKYKYRSARYWAHRRWSNLEELARQKRHAPYATPAEQWMAQEMAAPLPHFDIAVDALATMVRYGIRPPADSPGPSA